MVFKLVVNILRVQKLWQSSLSFCCNIVYRVVNCVLTVMSVIFVLMLVDTLCFLLVATNFNDEWLLYVLFPQKRHLPLQDI